MDSFDGFLDDLRGQLVTCAASCPERERRSVAGRRRRARRLGAALAVLLVAGLALGVVLGRAAHFRSPVGRSQGTAALVLPPAAGGPASAPADQRAGLAAPNPGYFLYDAAARGEDDVWAAGIRSVVDKTTGNEVVHSLILQWDGTAWKQAPAPDWGAVRAVSVDSAGGVWAAAGFAPRGQRVLNWDGHVWTAYALPAEAGWIRDLVAIAPNDVWAVGELDGGAITRGITTWIQAYVTIVHWDGTSWRTMAAPQGSRRGFLESVSATSADDVWAVGRRDGWPGSGTSLGNLVLHWDGRAWSSVPSPYRGDSWLNTVAAIGPGDVWAGGGNLLQQWDGRLWRKVPHAFNTYSQLSAQSASDIWLATGNAGVVHWDGRRWRPFTFRQMGVAGAGRSMAAEAVTVASQRSVWVVGEIWPPRVGTGFTPARPLILHWDGASWHVVVDSVRESVTR